MSLDIQRAQSVDLPEPLTPREFAILTLVARGVSNREIAQQAYISLNTVKFHLKNIYSKLGATNRIQAIRWLDLQLTELRRTIS